MKAWISFPELVWEFLTCGILSSWIWYKKLWSLSENDAMVHGSWPAHRVSEKRMMHLRRSSWVSVQFLWAQDGLIWGEFSFYRGVHTSCWSVSQVHLIGGAWLLLALVTPKKAVRVYWDRRLLTTFHKCVHVSLGFLQQQYQDMMWCEPADLSLMPCVVFVVGRWRAASRCWKSNRLTVWRDSWTHWGEYECRRVERYKSPPPSSLWINVNVTWMCFCFFRYTTRHLHDDSTSKQIRALLQWNKEEKEATRRGGGGETKERTWRRRKQTLINLFVYNEQREKSSLGLSATWWQ